jgi:hypothetical protein
MTWFSLPDTQNDNKGAFFDSESATRWLSGQPRANAAVMLAALVEQIEAFNGFRVAPRERYRTLEVLRKTVFAVSGECQRRYENKLLPLLAAEQSALSMVRRLWRGCATAYLHCLRACLDGDASITPRSAKVAHRALSCLRLEQMNCYLAAAEIDGEFWRILHAVLASGEQLGVLREPVEDPLLGETRESTVTGQYSMMILLHLARPYTLTRGQFSAVTRWLVRWREQAKIFAEPDANPKSCCIALDLSQDRTIHDNRRAATLGRWLSISSILRKIGQRLDGLAAGESPEQLKLGSGLSVDACVSLLNELADHLKYPQMAAASPGEAVPLDAASGLENIFRLLGGTGLKDAAASASPFGSSLSQQQIAVFDHVVRDTDTTVASVEQWRLVREEAGEMSLVRAVGSGEARLMLGGLLALYVQQRQQYALATIVSLYAQIDGSLCITARLFASVPAPVLAEVREKPSGKVSRHPAFLLPSEEGGGVPLLVLPVGLAAQALSVRFYEAREYLPLALRPLRLIERVGDNERWSFVIDQ